MCIRDSQYILYNYVELNKQICINISLQRFTIILHYYMVDHNIYIFVCKYVCQPPFHKIINAVVLLSLIHICVIHFIVALTTWTSEFIDCIRRNFTHTLHLACVSITLPHRQLQFLKLIST